MTLHPALHPMAGPRVDLDAFAEPMSWQDHDPHKPALPVTALQGAVSEDDIRLVEIRKLLVEHSEHVLRRLDHIVQKLHVHDVQPAIDVIAPTSCASSIVPKPKSIAQQTEAPSETVVTSQKSFLSLGGEEDDTQRKEDAKRVTQSKKRLERRKNDEPTSFVYRIVTGFHFQIVGTVLIISNTVLIAADVQHTAANKGQISSGIVSTLHHVYAAAFLLELLLRMIGEKLMFFRQNLLWNLFDTILVLCAVLESASTLLLSSAQFDGIRSISSLRIVRMLRVFRILRVLRIPRIIRFISALRTLIHTIGITMKELFWVVILLFLIVFIFAIAFTQAFNDHSNYDDVKLCLFFGSLWRSMSTLFWCITSGVSWGSEVSLEVEKLGLVWNIVLLGYIFFSYFAVLNVITGVFCNSAIESTARDPDLVAMSIISSKRVYIDKIRKLFQSVDHNRSGTITFGDLEALMENENMQAYMEALGLEAADAWVLFKLIDEDRTHTIDIEEFISGVMRLKGHAKSLDIALLSSDCKFLISRIGEFMTLVDRQNNLMGKN